MSIKGMKEVYAQFFEEPTREKLHEVLENKYGESGNLDFKSEWIEKSELAKIVLAIANSGGGSIIFGVKEENGTLQSYGIDNVKDSADFRKEIEKFIPKNLLKNIDLIQFIYDSEVYNKIRNKRFQVVFINAKNDQLPYVCESDGSKVNKGDIYFRRGTNSVKISYEELQEIISLRLDTQYSSTKQIELEEELAQLEILYDNIPQYESSLFGGISLFSGVNIPNKNYPEEDFEEFVSSLIEKKKRKIEKLIL